MYDMKISVDRFPVRNTSPAIDLYLSAEDLEVIYERWGAGHTKYGWDTPISMRGGITAITCLMMKKVPVEQLEKIYFKKRTQLIVDAMSRVSVS